MKRVVPYLLLVLMAMALQTQPGQAQDAIFSQFFSSPMYLNPAYAGTENGFRMTTNFRSQPIPDATNFSTISASVDVFVPSMYGGLGLIVISDHQGEMAWNNHIDAIYAVHIRLSQEWNLNFGAQAGYFRRDIRWGNLDFLDPNQPPPEEEFVHSPNFGAGMLLFNDWFYAGLATHHMAEPNQSVFSNHKLPRKITAHMGMHFAPPEARRANTVPYEYFFSPNIIYQQQGGIQRINFGLYAGAEPVMVGAWYRHNLQEPSAVIFLAGIRQGDFTFGYSYDYSLSGSTDIRHGVHEISLTFILMSEQQQRRLRVPPMPF